MKKIAFLSSLVLLLLVGTSCVHRAPYEPEYWFQALGEEGEYVLTADVERITKGEGKELVDPALLSNPMTKKAERISLSLTAEESERYPLPASAFAISGAVEGKFSSTVVNSSLKFSGYKKVKKNGVVRYQGDGTEIYSPFSNLILFTDGDYDQLYEKTIEHREKLIDDKTASSMASALFSVYVFSPKTLVDIGFEIPQTVLSEMTRTCLLFDEKSGVLVLSGRIETTGDGTARALSTLLKNQIVQEKRRNGEKLDTAALSKVFTVTSNVVNIEDYPLTGEMKKKATEIMKNGMGGLI